MEKLILSLRSIGTKKIEFSGVRKGIYIHHEYTATGEDIYELSLAAKAYLDVSMVNVTTMEDTDTGLYIMTIVEK